MVLKMNINYGQKLVTLCVWQDKTYCCYFIIKVPQILTVSQNTCEIQVKATYQRFLLLALIQGFPRSYGLAETGVPGVNSLL